MNFNLLLLPRPIKRIVALSVDTTTLIFCWWLTFALKFNAIFPSVLLSSLEVLWLDWLVFLPIFVLLGLYREMARYIEWRAHFSIAKGVLTGSVVLFLIGKATSWQIPLSFLIQQAFFVLFFTSASRLLLIWLYRNALKTTKKQKSRIAIYGAGSSGAQLLQAIRTSSDMEAVLFVDDRKDLKGSKLGGIPIHRPKELQTLITQFELEKIILAMPSISNRRRKEIIQELGKLRIHVMAVPNLIDLASGNVKVEDIREIDISDLLGRDIVPPNLKFLTACVENQVVMVTGAGGSIGGELCRKIIKLNPKKLVLYERSEYALYTIELELKRQGIQFPVVSVLGSVLNANKLERMIKQHQVESIYHAAAYKHVPIVESYPVEGVENNIWGTLLVAEAAVANGVKNFVLISTDKAVRPTSVMGATKRFSELILQSLAAEQASRHTRFSMVRFGNVLNSSGSVVPLFREQIKQGGPITVTHQNVVRYFMTIPEAAQLVLQAGSLSQNGDVLVLNMGEPVRIYELARHMIRLSGLTVKDEENPDGDIEVQVTGLRPGEKLFEELLIEHTATPTEHTMIFREHPPGLKWTVMQSFMEQLKAACLEDNSDKIKILLAKAIPDYQPFGVRSELQKRSEKPVMMPA